MLGSPIFGKPKNMQHCGTLQTISHFESALHDDLKSFHVQRQFGRRTLNPIAHQRIEGANTTRPIHSQCPYHPYQFIELFLVYCRFRVTFRGAPQHEAVAQAGAILDQEPGGDDDGAGDSRPEGIRVAAAMNASGEMDMADNADAAAMSDESCTITWAWLKINCEFTRYSLQPHI